MPDVSAALAAAPLVLDGGLGTMLESRGHDLSGELWSARVLIDAPDDVRAVHAAFAAAGADVLTTGSYQLGYENLAAAGLDVAAADRLLVSGVDLARRGAADAGRDVWVAASVGPYGATRADGSEYTGDYDLSVAELAAWHRRRLESLAAAEPDLLAFETIASPAEAEAVCRAIEGIGMPAWIALSGASTAFDAATVRDTLVAVAAAPGVVAVGLNCCPPEAITPAIRELPAAAPFVVYPNSGESWDPGTRTWRGTPGLPLAELDTWLAAGARLVGGCCRTTPDDVAAVRQRLSAPA